MPIGDHLGGFIRPGFNPLLVADAPTIGTASSGGGLDISIAFTAPSDVGGGAITSYEAVATDTVTAATFTASGTSSPISITGLTDGQSYTTTVTAINDYGPSGISGTSNSVQAEDVVGELWGWGYNSEGQLGQGNTTTYSSPVQVGSLTTWLHMTGGYQFQISIKGDKTLWGTGLNDVGQLGVNTGTPQYSSPVQVGTLTDWTTEIGAGRDWASAIKTDGTLWAWGSGSYGRLGLGNTTNYSSPKQVGALATWSKLSCGENFTAAIKTDGTLWTWGYGGKGQLGQGNTTSYSSPVQVGALTTWSTIACGWEFAAAIKTDGTLWAFGNNGDGQLGQGNTTNYSSPVQIGALTTWSKISGGNKNLAMIKTDGSLWGVGYNEEGSIGDGTSVSKSSPVQVGALTTWSKISRGSNTSFGLSTGGTLWSWGRNSQGRLGLNNTTYYSSPKQIGSLTTWKNIQNPMATAISGAAIK